MTVHTTAALFPGQGAYFAGALAGVRDDPEVRELVREIDEVAVRHAGGSVSEPLFATDGPAIDELLGSAPDLLQLAIYTASVAAHRLLLNRGVRPDVLVGHSFGEIAALVGAGAFTPADGARIVCHRDAALRESAEPDGYLLAVRADAARAERILGLIGDARAVVAAENHDQQTILAGPQSAMDTAVAVAAALGLGALALRAPYPFHSPLVHEAAFDFADRIRDIPQAPLGARVYSPILGRVYRDVDRLTALLAGHLIRPVRFAPALRELRAAGVGVFVECGPLDGLTKIARAVLGSDAEYVAPLTPAAATVEVIAELAGVPHNSSGADEQDAVHQALAPGLSAAEFKRRWREHVERIMHRTIAEFDAEVDPRASVAKSASTDALDTEDYDWIAPAPVPRASAPTALPAAPAAPAPAFALSSPERAELLPGGPDIDAVPPRAELLRELVVLYADALEYPPEVFDEDTDLESELGVDSVKQTELLRRVGDNYRLGPLPTDFKLGEHNTLGRIADLINSG